jgi:hypothetical protein
MKFFRKFRNLAISNWLFNQFSFDEWILENIVKPLHVCFSFYFWTFLLWEHTFLGTNLFVIRRDVYLVSKNIHGFWVLTFSQINSENVRKVRKQFSKNFTLFLRTVTTYSSEHGQLTKYPDNHTIVD